MTEVLQNKYITVVILDEMVKQKFNPLSIKIILNPSYRPNYTLDLWFTIKIYNNDKIIYNLPVLHKNTANIKWNRINSEGNLIIPRIHNKFTLIFNMYYRGTHINNNNYCDLVKYTGLFSVKSKNEWFKKILTRQYDFNY